MNVDGTEDWEWLFDVKVNCFKLFYCLESFEEHLLGIRLLQILEKYKSRIPDDLSWHIFQLYSFLTVVSERLIDIPGYDMYLRYGANQQCGLVRNATCSKMFAREMLDQTRK